MTRSQPIQMVAFSGNSHRPSRSRNMADLIARRIQRHVAADLAHYDIIDASPGLGAALTRQSLTPEALAVVEAVERADVLVVCTPVYKGSYTGLFKHFFDFVEVTALVGKPVVISATGGGPRHALVVEHQLRPLFGFFSALTIPTAIYAEDQNFEGGDIVDPSILARIDMAAEQTAALIGTTHRPAAQRAPGTRPADDGTAGPDLFNP